MLAAGAAVFAWTRADRAGGGGCGCRWTAAGVRAGDRLAGPARGRGHRRHPARLAAVLPGHHPAGPGRCWAAARCSPGGPFPGRIRLWDTPLQLVPAAALVVAAVFAVRARRRLTAVVLVGVTGYATAMLFILHGAPDLALTQFLVETCTMVMFVLVLRRLPGHFSAPAAGGQPAAAGGHRRRGRRGGRRHGVRRRPAGRQAAPISTAFPEPAVSYGGGRNVVNVTLVDIRAWDTMGEISVLVVAATGVPA